jgi:hypothetical protein
MALPTTTQTSLPLPSQSSAAALVAGDLSAAPMVVAHLLGRAGLIAVGMAIVGERDGVRLIKYGVAGAAVVELFVVIHELANQQSKPRT